MGSHFVLIATRLIRERGAQVVEAECIVPIVKVRSAGYPAQRARRRFMADFNYKGLLISAIGILAIQKSVVIVAVSLP